MFAYDDPVVLSKALIKFAGDNDKLKIKGGVFEGRFMDTAGVKVLSQMPSKPELQAKLLAMINAPATQLLRHDSGTRRADGAVARIVAQNQRRITII